MATRLCKTGGISCWDKSAPAAATESRFPVQMWHCCPGRLRHLTACVILCIAASGCESDSGNAPASSREKLITRVQQNNAGTVSVRVSVNDTANALIAPVTETSTRLQITGALLDTGENTIDIEFVLLRPDSGEVSLATTRQQFFYSGTSATVEVQGTSYGFPDDDQDTLPNLLEILVQPADIDNDGQENFTDSDSDADGIDDALDAFPYGAPEASNTLPSIAGLNFLLPDQSEQSISINRISGSGQIASTLDTRSTALPVLEPANWPWQFSRITSAENWQLIELPVQSTSLCPRSATSIDIDTSSFQINVSRQVTGYFERFDGIAFSVPIDSGSISNLDGFSRNDNVSGNLSLDNGLRAILVPPDTAGFITLWTRAGFTGDQCQINLANHSQ